MFTRSACNIYLVFDDFLWGWQWVGYLGLGIEKSEPAPTCIDPPLPSVNYMEF